MEFASLTTLAEAVSPGAAAGFVPVVGIVGGVGSGKSAVVRAVSGVRLWVIDADKIGHQQLQDSAVADRLVREFGKQILEGGVISRVRLAALVFQNSPDADRRLQRLNEI
ncbi:MAG: dephospho-CoA kinase, partial [Planctomycetaceae bacterium]